MFIRTQEWHWRSYWKVLYQKAASYFQWSCWLKTLKFNRKITEIYVIFSKFLASNFTENKAQLQVFSSETLRNIWTAILLNIGLHRWRFPINLTKQQSIKHLDRLLLMISYMVWCLSISSYIMSLCNYHNISWKL